MPRYEFECNKCQEKFEIFLSIIDKKSTKIVCPKCKSEDIAQIYSGINIKSSAKAGPNGCCGGSGCCG